MTQLFVNNLVVKLASGIDNISNTIAVENTTDFPVMVQGDWFYLTLSDKREGGELRWEVVKVTSYSANTLTVIRAQGDTTAQSWSVGSELSLRVTAADMFELEAFKDSKGRVNGLAPLDSSSQVPVLNIPNLDAGKLTSGIIDPARYVASDVLTKIKTVDGASSGLDADLLDGQQGSYYAPVDSPQLSGQPTIYGKTISSNTLDFRNHIIDGRFDFWHQATSQTTNGYGSDTMWFNKHNVSTKTHSRQTFGVGEYFPDATQCPRYYSRTMVSSVTGDNSYVVKEQRMEDVTRLAGKEVRLTFYAKADTTKSIGVGIVQEFGTGGSPSASVLPTGQKITLTTAWTKYIVNFYFPSITGKTLGTDGVHTSYSVLRFYFDLGTASASLVSPALGQQSGTFDIAMVQLEEGYIPTEFQNLPIQVEAIRVGRYYEQEYCSPAGAIQFTPNGDTRVNIPFSVEKRTNTPSCSMSGDWNVIVFGATADAANVLITPTGEVIEATKKGIYLIVFNTDTTLQGCGDIVAMGGHTNSLLYKADARF